MTRTPGAPDFTKDLATVRRARFIARLMDEAFVIPGTGIKIGLDALVGLIPGIGDLVSGIISTFLVAQAIDLGLPRSTVLRMALNVLIDTGLGGIPLVGDVFDAFWKSNVKNADLLESGLEGLSAGRSRGRKDWVFLVAVVGTLLLACVGMMTVGLAILRFVHDWIVNGSPGW